MLDNKRLTMLSDSVIDNEKVASFGAVINLTTLELDLSSRYIDKAACKTNRDVVRQDQADFENLAYEIQDMLKKITDFDTE